MKIFPRQIKGLLITAGILSMLFFFARPVMAQEQSSDALLFGLKTQYIKWKSWHISPESAIEAHPGTSKGPEIQYRYGNTFIIKGSTIDGDYQFPNGMNATRTDTEYSIGSPQGPFIGMRQLKYELRPGTGPAYSRNYKLGTFGYRLNYVQSAELGVDIEFLSNFKDPRIFGAEFILNYRHMTKPMVIYAGFQYYYIEDAGIDLTKGLSGGILYSF